MAKVTWNGASGDPDQIEQYGHTFPKGEAVEVSNGHPKMGKFKGHPNFTVEDGEDALDEEEDVPPFIAVHKVRGKWIVEGPDGTPDYGPFDKEGAATKAAELNAEAAKAAEVPAQ